MEPTIRPTTFPGRLMIMPVKKIFAFILVLMFSMTPSCICRGSSTLSARENVTTGNNPNSLAIGDLNADGYNDIVTADESSGTLSLLLFNATTGDFDARKVLSGAGQPVAVATGDLDGSGMKDVVYVSAGDDIIGMFFLNSTSGEWEGDRESVIPGGSIHPECITSCDLDMDGTDEAVVGASGSDEVIVLAWNNEGNNWTVHQRIDVAAHPRSLKAGNLTGSPHPDIAVASSSEDKVTILGGSTGGLSHAQVLSVGDTPYSVDLGDLNGDGLMDLACAEKNGANISYYYNQGGHFQDRKTVSCGGSPWDVEIGDYDNDGHEDILVVSGNRLELQLIRFDGDLLDFVVAEVRQTGRYPRDVEVEDLDGDGDLDVALVNRNDHMLSVYTSNSIPAFHPPGEVPGLNEGQDSSQLFIDLRSHFTDVEDGVDELSFAVRSFDQATNYTAAIKNSRYLTLDCRDGSDFFGNMTIIVEAEDTGGNAGGGSFTVRVHPLPDPPIIERIGNVSVFQVNPVFYLYEHELYEASITASDPDGDVLFYTSNVTDPGKPGYVEDFQLNSSTGRISFRPGRDEVGNLSVRFTVTDSSGLASHVNAVYNIHDVNDAPELIKMNEQEFTAGTPDFVAAEGFWLNVTVTAADPEGDELRYSLEGAPPNMRISGGTGNIFFLPMQEDVDRGPDYSVKLMVRDGHGLNDTEVFTLGVIDVNMAPTVNGYDISSPAHPEGYDVGETIDIDLHTMDPDGNAVNITWYADRVDRALGYGHNLSYAFDAEGEYEIRAVLEDEKGKNHTWRMRIKIIMFNSPPRIVGNNIKNTEVSAAYEVKYDGVDLDDDPLAWSLRTNCSWLNISASGVLGGNVPENASGKTYTVRIILTDGNGGRAEREFILRVGEEVVDDDDDGTDAGGDGEEKGSPLIMIYIGVGLLVILALAIMLVIPRIRRKTEEKEAEDEEEYAEIEDTEREMHCPSCGLELKSLDDRYSRECPNCGFERW